MNMNYSQELDFFKLDFYLETLINDSDDTWPNKAFMRQLLPVVPVNQALASATRKARCKEGQALNHER